MVLPMLVKGRTPVLDALGALIWAAGLISALRLVSGGTSPPGLLFGALCAAALATLLARRLGPPAELAGDSVAAGGSAMTFGGH
jgi:hypothetical protein